MKLEGIVLSEVRQKNIDRYRMNSVILTIFTEERNSEGTKKIVV